MDFYVLECSATECVAEFYLNDIPVTRRGPDYGTEFDGPINYLVVDGENTLEAVIQPGSTPAASIPGDGPERTRQLLDEGAGVKAALVRYPKGAAIGGPDGQELFALNWSAQPQAQMFPRVVGTACDLGAVYGRWIWQDADRLVLDGETRQEIFDFLLMIHGHMVVGDFEEFINFSRLRNEEADRAYDKGAGMTEMQIRAMRGDPVSIPDWGMAPLIPDNFDLRLCGKGRLVECVTKSWKAVIEEIPDEEGAVNRYPMMITRIDGHWQIVR